MRQIDNFGNKRNTNGFDKNPENINREGRPLSVKSDLKRLLTNEGELRIKADNVKRIHKNGDVTIHLAKSETLAVKLMEWALCAKGSESLKAIKMIIEQTEGKPNQKTEVSLHLEPITGMMIT